MQQQNQPAETASVAAMGQTASQAAMGQVVVPAGE
jgi:hypothetical protein